MMKTKIFAGVLLIIAVLFAQVGSVLAAPAMQDGSITGKVTALECGTDSEGNTTILVTLEDAEGMSQTVNIDLATADSLGLVTYGEDELPDCSAEAFAAILDAAPEEGLEVMIAPEDVIPDEEESNHPISVLLAAFFGEDASVIDGYHDDGFGFGVIAQALWMSQNYGGDAALTGVILEAKTTGDYSAITLPDGSTPSNWGQFKKALSEKKNNLGNVVSGHGNNDSNTDTTVEEQSQPGNGHGNGNNNGNASNNKDKDKSNNGKGNNKNK